MAQPGRVFTRPQLLDKVWGESAFVEERTVDVHVRRLRVALGTQGEALLETVRGVGYRLAAPAG
jgi:two-component system phosphate regulon response regulator PhoB